METFNMGFSKEGGKMLFTPKMN